MKPENDPHDAALPPILLSESNHTLPPHLGWYICSDPLQLRASNAKYLCKKKKRIRKNYAERFRSHQPPFPRS